MFYCSPAFSIIIISSDNLFSFLSPLPYLWFNCSMILWEILPQTKGENCVLKIKIDLTVSSLVSELTLGPTIWLVFWAKTSIFTYTICQSKVSVTFNLCWCAAEYSELSALCSDAYRITAIVLHTLFTHCCPYEHSMEFGVLCVCVRSRTYTTHPLHTLPTHLLLSPHSHSPSPLSLSLLRYNSEQEMAFGRTHRTNSL